MWYALKYLPTNKWLGVTARLVPDITYPLLQFYTVGQAKNFGEYSPEEWSVHGPFPSYPEMRKHELWHDFNSDYWHPQVETVCDSEIYLNFLDWLSIIEE